MAPATVRPGLLALHTRVWLRYQDNRVYVIQSEGRRSTAWGRTGTEGGPYPVGVRPSFAFGLSSMRRNALLDPSPGIRFEHRCIRSVIYRTSFHTYDSKPC